MQERGRLDIYRASFYAPQMLKNEGGKMRTDRYSEKSRFIYGITQSARGLELSRYLALTPTAKVAM
jgi:hypothetical protein